MINRARTNRLVADRWIEKFCDRIKLFDLLAETAQDLIMVQIYILLPRLLIDAVDWMDRVRFSHASA